MGLSLWWICTNLDITQAQDGFRRSLYRYHIVEIHSMHEPRLDKISWSSYYSSRQSGGGWLIHCDVILGAMESQITCLTIVYWTIYSGADQRKHQSSTSLAVVRGIHQCPVNSPHKWPITQIFLFIWWRHHAMEQPIMQLAVFWGSFTNRLRPHQWNPVIFLVGLILILRTLSGLQFPHFTVTEHVVACVTLWPDMVILFHDDDEAKRAFTGFQSCAHKPFVKWVPCSINYINPSTNRYHDDVNIWKHFPRYWPFVRGIHRSPVNSQHKGQWRGALMFSLIGAWTDSWANNGDAGDLRRCRAHYDVIVMTYVAPHLTGYYCFCRDKWLQAS